MEMLVWAFVGFWKLCGAIFSQSGRAQVAERWSRGGMERLMIIGGAAFWVPVLIIGFGLGLPLVFGLITKSFQTKETRDLPLTGEAVIVLPHSKHPDKEMIVRVERSRLSEISETKDLSDLGAKLREISLVEERKKPIAAEPMSTGGTPPAAPETRQP